MAEIRSLRKRKLDNWLDAYLDYVEDSEPDPLYHKWVGVSVIASVLQRTCYLHWDSQTFANFYIVLVGPPGGRKGTAMNFGRDILDKIEGVRYAADATSFRALIDKIEGARTTDALPDGMGMVDHCSLTIFSPELAVFLRDGKSMFEILTDLYDCGSRWKYDTQHAGSHDLKNVWLNMIGATTPVLLHASLVSEAVGGGLTSRMIFINAFGKYKTVVFPFQVKVDEEKRDALIHDLSIIKSMVGQYRITDEFMKFWEEWYPYSDEHPPPNLTGPNFEGYIQRRPKHLLKLSMVMSASRCSDLIIDRQDAEKALEYLEGAESVMHYALASLGASDITPLLNSVIADLEKYKEMKLSDLMAKYYADADAETMARVIKTLKAMKKVSAKAIENGGDVMIKIINK